MDSYSFQAQVTRISPVGLVPEGLRIDVGFAGTVSDGPLSGSAIEGIDYLLIRSDGVAVIDARELVAGAGAVAAAIHAEGYVVPPFEMPELSALVDPSFAWPDVDLPLHGSARMQSAMPALASVNWTVFAFTGSVNMANGSLLVRARAILDEGRYAVEGVAASAQS